MSKKERLYLSESQIVDLIEKKYPLPAWVVLTQLRDGTGFATKGQSADAFAFGVWPSRGLEIHGFEVKSWRNDWLRELKRPDKAEFFFKHVDYWWLVSDQEVAKIEEIPSNWGWMEVSGRCLKIKKQAPKFEGVTIDRLFLMSIMRGVSTAYVPREDLKKLVDIEKKQWQKEQEESVKDELKEAERRMKNIEDFEKITGLQIDKPWSEDRGKKVGELVNLVLESNLSWTLKDIRRGALEVGRCLRAIKNMKVFQGD